MGSRILVPVLILLLVGGCGRADTESKETYRDDLNRTVALQPPVDRVVSLAPNLTEIVYAAGAGEKLVAVTASGDYPPPVDTVDHVSALPVDFEAIAAKNPDLVLATDQINAPGDIDTFDALGVPIYFFSFDTLNDVVDAVRRTGELLGTSTTASDSARALRRRLDRLRRQTGSLSQDERPRVLVLVGDETLYSFGAGSYVHTLVELAGGQSITRNIETQAPTLSDEYVLTEKPDVIVGTWGPDYDPSRLLSLHPTWDVVPAVKNDRVYSLRPELVSRPGPRVVQGARQLARRLHPRLFESLDAGAAERDTGRTPSSNSSARTQ